jgi:hypothetical protein
MSGGLLPHALTALTAALRGRNCRAVGSDLRVGVAKQGPFFYPDVSVYCGEAQLADDFKDTLLSPTLVIEVLSPSSEPYDRGKKFAAYRRIDFPREYVLVSQTERSVESYLRRPDDKWILTEFLRRSIGTWRKRHQGVARRPGGSAPLSPVLDSRWEKSDSGEATLVADFAYAMDFHQVRGTGVSYWLACYEYHGVTDVQ